jgi:hypothetical protein
MWHILVFTASQFNQGILTSKALFYRVVFYIESNQIEFLEDAAVLPNPYYRVVSI